MTANDNPDVIDLAEAARILGVNPKVAARWARQGRFPGGAAVRIAGRMWRVSVPRLTAYLHGQP